jgi:hypothetical protein
MLVFLYIMQKYAQKINRDAIKQVFTFRWSHCTRYFKGHRGSSFEIRGKNITFRGRGIFDQGLVPRTTARRTMSVTVDGFKIEGVVLRNSSQWTVSLRDYRSQFRRRI